MKVISVKGGLGNQMFAYAAYLALRKKLLFQVVLLEMTEIWGEHNGKDIIKVFDHLNWHSYKYYRRVQKLYSEYATKSLFALKTENETDYGNYVKDYFGFLPLFCCYSGYWQTEKYFEKVANKVKKTFRFNVSKLNGQSREMASEIINDPFAVSVHVRKGDYSKYQDVFCDICSDGYYDRAIDVMKKKYPFARFYYFSDDVDFVRANFDLSDKDAIVDWNKGDDSWQDMYLMSICKHNIIANSTFSWWGAWLNASDSKMVIAPKNWFVKCEGRDIAPEKWIRL